MSLCPCGSTNPYIQCCACFIEKKQLPQTPEQLMRSRYTAYSMAKIDYIKDTMAGKALFGFNPIEAQKWAQSVIWLGLKVIHAEPTTSDVGFVEFIARFKESGQVKTIHERSEFHKQEGRWFYVDGELKKTPLKTRKPHVARNSPCPCGSGKKFKNCHAN
ncbi:MAG: YchJ family protein [Legionella sp.]|uniref:YchJ family protein n=1 Tax=Legionella sp. TaxID=459 RepID=UPI0039E57BD0